MANGDKQRAWAQKMLAQNPNYFKELAAKGKGIKKSKYVIKPGSLTPAERGRLGGLSTKQKRASIGAKERQE